jgi:hypothetical protein
MSNNITSNKFTDQIHLVFTIRTNYFEARQEIMNNFPGYDRERDVRINIFSKCINALDGLYLGMVFFNNHLTEPAWWTETASSMRLREPPYEDKERW